MATTGVLSIIKNTVLSFLPDARVILFGSHARGDNNKDSDYDIMVITPNRLPKNQKMIAMGSWIK